MFKNFVHLGITINQFKMKKQLTTYCLCLCTMLSFGQIIVMDIVQVKEGKEAEYEAVEEFVAPIMGEFVANGDKMGWYIFKRIQGGDLSEVEEKGVGDYMIINVYKDREQMEANTMTSFTKNAQKVYQGKMSRRALDKKMASLMDARKDTRSYTLENIYYTKPNRLQLGDIVSVFPAQQLNEDYENFEMHFYRPIWEEMILTGAHKGWNFNRIVERSDNAYQNLTHIIFNVKGTGDYNFKDDFISTKLGEMGTASRKGFDTAEMKLIQIRE